MAARAPAVRVQESRRDRLLEWEDPRRWHPRWNQQDNLLHNPRCRDKRSKQAHPRRDRNPQGKTRRGEDASEHGTARAE